MGRAQVHCLATRWRDRGASLFDAVGVDFQQGSAGVRLRTHDRLSRGASVNPSIPGNRNPSHGPKPSRATWATTRTRPKTLPELPQDEAEATPRQLEPAKL